MNEITQDLSLENRSPLIKRITYKGNKAYEIDLDMKISSIQIESQSGRQIKSNIANNLLTLTNDEYDRRKNYHYSLVLDNGEKVNIILADNRYSILTFYVLENKEPVECFVKSSINQLHGIFQQTSNEIYDVPKNKRFYSYPYSKLLLTLGKIPLGAYADFINQYAKYFDSENKKETINYIKSSIYDTDYKGMLQLTHRNLEIISKIYSFEISFDFIKEEVIISNNKKLDSSSLDNKKALQDAIIKETFSIKLLDNINELSISNLRTNANIFIHSLSKYTDNNETKNISSTITDISNCLEFESNKDKYNFQEAFLMFSYDLIRKILQVDKSLIKEDSPSTQYLYNFISDSTDQPIKLIENLMIGELHKYNSLLSPDNLKKLFNHNSNMRNIICQIANIHKNSKEYDIKNFLNTNKQTVTTKGRQTTDVNKFTILTGSMESGDFLPFYDKRIIQIKFETADYTKLQNIDWKIYLKDIAQNIINVKYFFESQENNNYQKWLQYENLENGVYKFLGVIIKNYIDAHKEEKIVTYSPKTIFEKLNYKIDTDTKDTMSKRLSKELKQKKIQFVNGLGFKIPSSFFDKTLEEHLDSFKETIFN